MFQSFPQRPIAAALLRIAGLVGLIVWTCPASPQTSACGISTEALQKQLSGSRPAKARQAAQCIGDNAAEFAGAFQNLVDVIRLPTTRRDVTKTSVWAAGRIARSAEWIARPPRFWRES
jgi:hypothetical protein